MEDVLPAIHNIGRRLTASLRLWSGEITTPAELWDGIDDLFTLPH